jgi:Zn finger protein HypA/HybF involved in hydrogenase expression
MTLWCPVCERHEIDDRHGAVCPVCADKAAKAAAVRVVVLGWGLSA